MAWEQKHKVYNVSGSVTMTPTMKVQHIVQTAVPIVQTLNNSEILS